jgi:hypothetical protein
VVACSSGTACPDCLEVLDDFQHLLEEQLGVISTLSPACVDSRDRSLSPLR